MTDVYSNGLINLAASAAITSADGLFTSRDPLELTPYVVSASNKGPEWQNEVWAVWITSHSGGLLLMLG
jgi:hypothetical protein